MSRAYERLLESELIHTRAGLGETQTQLDLARDAVEHQRQMYEREHNTAHQLTAERDDLLRQLAVLDEWHCPNCGEVTRARMSDSHTGPPRQDITRAHEIMNAAITRDGNRPGEMERVAGVFDIPIEDDI